MFACEGGDSIVVALGPRFAELHLPPDRIVRLMPAPAASGATYTDGRYTLRTTGRAALLERGSKVILRGCATAAALPASDSALTPERGRAIADSIDAVTAELAPRSRTLEPEARGWEPRVLSLWSDSAGPLRLAVTEPTEAGKMRGSTLYYFVDGRLAVVRGPVSQYLFRDTTLILWTTDSLPHHVEVPLRDMVARQNFVRGEVRQYLAMFGIEH